MTIFCIKGMLVNVLFSYFRFIDFRQIFLILNSIILIFILLKANILHIFFLNLKILIVSLIRYMNASDPAELCCV